MKNPNPSIEDLIQLQVERTIDKWLTELKCYLGDDVGGFEKIEDRGGTIWIKTKLKQYSFVFFSYSKENKYDYIFWHNTQKETTSTSFRVGLVKKVNVNSDKQLLEYLKLATIDIYNLKNYLLELME